MRKEKLRELSPADSDEVLIKQRVQPEFDAKGNVVFKGDGRKTVDVQQIEDRFTSLNIDTDWKRFKKVVGIRNDIEHYCTTESTDRLKELIADSFIIIRNFLSSQLGYLLRYWANKLGRFFLMSQRSTNKSGMNVWTLQIKLIGIVTPCLTWLGICAARSATQRW